MLQQTQARTVIPYFRRWMERFPDWEALADAEIDDVLLEWKGLGYYARAQRLHASARQVRERHSGRLPHDPRDLAGLPGVGDYTAAAVASIAFGAPVAAVDGNVRRVLARLFDWPDPAPARLRAAAAGLLDPSRPGDHNEAMMELGATICMPRAPRCEACPVAAWCAALRAGTVAARPAPRARRRPPHHHFASAVAVDDQGRVLLARRPPEGLLAGMWEFPSRRIAPGADASAAALRCLGDLLQADPAASCADFPDPTLFARRTKSAHRRRVLGPDLPISAEPLPPVAHAFTHLRATYHPVMIRWSWLTADPGPPDTLTRSDGAHRKAAAQASSAHAAPPAAPQETAWVPLYKLDEWALPVAQQKIAAQLARADS